MGERRITISALMPVYDGVDLDSFKAAYNSLLGQTRLPEELIIVLDGPVSDSIRSYINSRKEFLTTEVVELPENMGTGIASEQGLHRCKYDWIARVDADDVSFPERFAIMEKFILDNPEVCICGSLMEEVPDLFVESDISFIRKVPMKHADIVRYGRIRYPFNNPTLFVRRAEALIAGGYRDLEGYEDWDMALRIFRIKGRAANIGKVLVRAQQNYTRRTGWDKYRDDLGALKQFRKEGHLSRSVFVLNILVRLAARIFPFLTPNIYRWLLRTRRRLV